MSTIIKPFTPSSKTLQVGASVTPPAGELVEAFSPNSDDATYRIYNSGAIPVFVGYGKTATEAQANSVAPAAAQQKCLVMGPGTIEVFQLSAGTYFSAATAADTASVYVVAGEGI